MFSKGSCLENMFRLPHSRFRPGSISLPSGACTRFGSVDSEVVPCSVHSRDQVFGVDVSDTCSPTFTVRLVVHPLIGIVLEKHTVPCIDEPWLKMASDIGPDQYI